MLVDLHVHTNQSDGKLSVEETMQIAYESKLDMLAITDHDSIFAIPKAQMIAKNLGIHLISGVELSCRNDNHNVNFPLDLSIHILGYNIKYKDAEFNRVLENYHFQRKKELSDLIKNLNKKGLEIEYDNIFVIAGTQMRIQDIVNHINTYSLDRKQKEKYISYAESYYQDVFRIDFEVHDAIQMIRELGGTAIWAHPFFSYKDYDIKINSKQKIDALLDRMCDLGLDGIETYYMRHSSEQVLYLEYQAKKRGLLSTAGSDFHGYPPRNRMLKQEIPEIQPFFERLKTARFSNEEARQN